MKVPRDTRKPRDYPTIHLTLAGNAIAPLLIRFHPIILIAHQYSVRTRSHFHQLIIHKVLAEDFQVFR